MVVSVETSHLGCSLSRRSRPRIVVAFRFVILAGIVAMVMAGSRRNRGRRFGHADAAAPCVSDDPVAQARDPLRHVVEVGCGVVVDHHRARRGGHHDVVHPRSSSRNLVDLGRATGAVHAFDAETGLIGGSGHG